MCLSAPEIALRSDVRLIVRGCIGKRAAPGAAGVKVGMISVTGGMTTMRPASEVRPRRDGGYALTLKC